MAQENSLEKFDKDRLSLALDGGFNFSKFTGSFASFVFSGRLGVQLRLHAEYPLNDNPGAKSGIYFITKRAATRLSSVESTFGLSYLEVPLQLMYHVADDVTAYRGLTFGFRTSSSMEISTSLGNFNIVNEFGQSCTAEATNTLRGIYQKQLMDEGLTADIAFSQGDTTANLDYGFNLNNRSLRLEILYYL